jgi:hypothetical protein
MAKHSQEIERKWLVRDLPRLRDLKGNAPLTVQALSEMLRD